MSGVRQPFQGDGAKTGATRKLNELYSRPAAGQFDLDITLSCTYHSTHTTLSTQKLGREAPGLSTLPKSSDFHALEAFPTSLRDVSPLLIPCCDQRDQWQLQAALQLDSILSNLCRSTRTDLLRHSTCSDDQSVTVARCPRHFEPYLGWN
jgi:hypothetical protein